MGPHILMRGLPTSPNEPAGICSHGKGRGLRPLPEESDSSSASPSSYYSKHSQEVCFRMSGRGEESREPSLPSSADSPLHSHARIGFLTMH